ncbi:MAG: hypothetical protein WAM82_17495 [Thermoanaerobaculia bacterium]
MSGSRKVLLLSLSFLAVLCPRLSAQEPATAISLRSRIVDTSRPEPALPEALRARPADATADEVVLVKFPGPVTARQVQALRGASLQVYTYLPYYSYLVKMPAGARTKSLLSSLWRLLVRPLSPGVQDLS